MLRPTATTRGDRWHLCPVCVNIARPSTKTDKPFPRSTI